MIFNTIVGGGSSKLFKGLVDGSITEIKESDLKGIEEIRDNAFHSCQNLTSVVIPDNVTSIGHYAFEFCKSLTSVTFLATTPPYLGTDVFNQTNEDLVIYVPKENIKEYRESWKEYSDKIQYKFTEGLSYDFDPDNEIYGVSGIGTATDTDIIIPDTYEGLPVVFVAPYAFKGNDSLTSVYIPDSVTIVAVESFFECNNLKSVVIGAGVTDIGLRAFAQCAKLEHIQSHTPHYISIDGNLYSDDKMTLIQYAIGKTAKSFTVPDGVENIGEEAFAFCENLTNIVLPNGLYDIGESAFARCDNLKSINIPDGVARIADQAFYGCDLENIIIPSSMILIDGFAFAHNSRLKSVIICGDNLSTIGFRAFYSCDSLTDFICYNPDPPQLASETFIDSTAISNIYVPDESVNAYKSATNWSAYADIIAPMSALFNTTENDDGVVITGLKNTSITDLVIPRQIGGANVVSIGDDAFNNNKQLKTVTFEEPSNVTSINTGAFYKCSGLTNIVIPDSVITIGTSAFESCYNLESVVIGNNVTKISDNAFRSCDLITVAIPDSVTTIGSRAFGNCNMLTSVVIGNGVKSIGSRAFAYSYGMTKVVIGSGVTSIGSYAFEGCNIVEVVNKSPYITVEKGSDNYGYLADSAFAVYNVGDEYQTKLSNDNGCIIYTDETEKILVGYEGRANDLVLPSYITKINNGAFKERHDLTSLIINDNVTSIGRNAFYYCSSLTSVVIGDSVTEIGGWVFNDCRSLTSVIVKAITPPSLGDYAISSSKSYIIYVPAESVYAYKSATNWSAYADYIQAIKE